MRWLFPLVASASIASAQLIAYESFSGMTAGGSLNGSGADATGWTQASWQGATSPYHSIGNQSPNMTYQITNGALLNGGDRCAIISTAPEPTAGTNAVTRTLPSLNSTFFVSFLIRPLSAGTGSDKIMLQFRSGSTYLGAIGFVLDEVMGQFRVEPQFGSTSGSVVSAVQRLSVGQTHFIAMRFNRASSTQFSYFGYINPPTTLPTRASFTYEAFDLPTNSSFNTLFLSSYSFDNAGPSSSIAIDEIRIGYTWNDVVPQSTTQTVVPQLAIAPAVAVNWQSKTNKSYQPQRSYDLTNWVDFGSTIAGDGQQKGFLDSADQVPKSFYRVIER
jgi:hypothetical protein